MRRDSPVGGVVMEKMNNKYQSNEDLNTFRLTPMKRMYYALGDFGYNFMYYWPQPSGEHLQHAVQGQDYPERDRGHGNGDEVS